MRFAISAIAAAALASVAFAVPFASQDIITTELPAKFAMYLVTEEPRANGLRIRYLNGNLRIPINERPLSPTVEAVFLGGRGRIGLFIPQHPTPPPPTEALDGYLNVFVLHGTMEVYVANEATQAKMESWGGTFRPITEHFVQDSDGILQLIVDGVVQPNSLRVCGTAQDTYQFWWDEFEYIRCAVAHFRVVAL